MTEVNQDATNEQVRDGRYIGEIIAAALLVTQRRKAEILSYHIVLFTLRDSILFGDYLARGSEQHAHVRSLLIAAQTRTTRLQNALYQPLESSQRFEYTG